jgi:hypothetical protein
MVVSPAKKPAARRRRLQDDRFGESDAASVESTKTFLAELDSNSFVPAALTPAQKAVKSTQAKKSLLPPRRKRSLQRRRLKKSVGCATQTRTTSISIPMKRTDRQRSPSLLVHVPGVT